jgi:hypothetical protein
MFETSIRIRIPPCWTADQADAVLDMLHEIETAVFLAYETQLSELERREDAWEEPDDCDEEPDPEPPHEDLPF